MNNLLEKLKTYVKSLNIDEVFKTGYDKIVEEYHKIQLTKWQKVLVIVGILVAIGVVYILTIKQNFVLLNQSGQVVSREERIYPNMMIKAMGMSGEEGETSVEKIVFSTLKEKK